ncbi:MAG: btuC [Gemmatimonadetes bacterium]|nr:btuC [Gemmatimonadota bacterium]
MTDLAWRAERVTFRHPGATRDALCDVTCDLAGGGVTAILGPNGAGKSTFVRLLIGLAAPTRGIVQFRGRGLTSWPRGAIAREIGFVPQGEESVFPVTVREVVAMGRYPHLGPWRAEAEEDRRIVRHALEDVDALVFADRPFSTLSGGEQQRVRIARALAQHGSAIVLDEPTAGLDVRHEIELFALLRGLAAHGRTVVLVTHNLSLASRLADRTLLFSEGVLVAQGESRSVLTGELLSRVYGWPIDVVQHPGPGAEAGGPLVVPRLTPPTGPGL